MMTANRVHAETERKASPASTGTLADGSGSPFALRSAATPATAGRPQRIAIVVKSLSGGGVQRKALFVASGLLERGHEVDLVVLLPICDLPDEIPDRCRLFFLSVGRFKNTPIPANLEHVSARQVAPERFPWRTRCERAARLASRHWKQLPFLAGTEFLGWAKGVAAYLERERPDAVLAMHISSVVPTTMARSLTGRHVHVVATLHKLFRTRRWLRRISGFYPHADFLVGISSDVAARLAGLTRLPIERIHTVYNPIVSADVSRKANEPVDHPWLSAPDRPVVLAAGRLEEEKDFPTLLSAFAMLLERRRARLIVIGKGSQLSMLRSLAEKLRIGEHVDFPGFVANPLPFMSGADLFVLSSRQEGLPTALVEAMACGCRVVSTDCRYGPAEILEGGRLGELVPVGDSRALADAMDRTLSTPPDPDVLRGRAAFFGVDPAVDRYEALLLDRSALDG